MGRPLRIEFPGAYYHVTSRGNERKDIFKSKKDCEQFLGYLESAVSRYGAVIHAWCLMSNHYHLLLETPLANLSQIMRHINGAYTNYFNAKRKRAGHLFQSRYKAILIDADDYLLELSRYIHLNPIKAGIASRPEDYPWSSFPEYAGLRPKSDRLTTRAVLEHFDGDRSRYRQFVEDALGHEYESPLEKTVAATILGSETFVKQITDKHLSEKMVRRDTPALRALAKLSRFEKIIAVVNEGVADEKLARKAKIYLTHRLSGSSLKELGEHFGMGESAISQTSRRFAELMEKDEKVQVTIERIKEKILM